MFSFSVLKSYNSAWGLITPRYAPKRMMGSGPKQIRAIIIGPPGSGKGTISERIVKEFKLFHLSSGDALRNQIEKKTDLGKRVQPLLAAGQLVPTSLMAPLIDAELQAVDPTKGWLLDGYPRNVEQATLLDNNVRPNIVIHLNVPFATIIDRIKGRYIHVKSGRVYNLDFNPPKVPGKDDETGEDLIQREDDKPASVEKRLKLYEETTKPVIEHYRKVNLLKEFRGTESNVIWPDVRQMLTLFMK